ncbi:MAG: putative membrane protein YagU involved in acid resistance [Shewanella sp.]
MSLTTPALLFPAISLLLLAYTNRFFALAALIRNLSSTGRPIQSEQLKNLRQRISIIRRMQESGVMSFALCVLCMLFIYIGLNKVGSFIFGCSLLLLLYSLLLSVIEIRISVVALNYHLEELDQ